MLKEKAKVVLVSAAFIGGMLLTGETQAAARGGIIENVTAVIASQSICGFAVNQNLLLLTMEAGNVSPADLQTGGKYEKEVAANKSRILALTSTPEKKKSFCRTVKSELSAMFD
jgi:hypothetical protein